MIYYIYLYIYIYPYIFIYILIYIIYYIYIYIYTHIYIYIYIYIYVYIQSSLDNKTSVFFSKFMFDDFLRKEGMRVGEWGWGGAKFYISRNLTIPFTLYLIFIRV